MDPFEREVIKGSMRAVQREMEVIVERTSMSPFIREKKDFFAGIFDAKGRLVLGTPLPFFGNLIQPILEAFPIATINDGDIYCYNDCYGSNGGVSHSPDMVFAAPVFVGGTLAAFVQTWGHLWDIGGLRAGSISPDAREIFHEGIIIPPTRIARSGEIQDEILNIIVGNSRFPEIVRGDIRSLLAACAVGRRRLLEIFERHGGQVLSAWRDFEKQTRHALARKLAAIPDGSYYAESIVESDGVRDGQYVLRLRLDKRDGELLLDTSDSDEQAIGPVNFLMHDSVPKLMLAIYLLADEPHVLVNGAAIEALGEVKLRPGSILAPRWPAPLGNRTHTEKRVQSGILGLLAAATDGNVPAPNAIFSICFIRGVDTATGASFLCSDGIAVGYGARPTGDGLDAIYYASQRNYPTEFLETVFPIRLNEYALHLDSGGPGEYRGGCGVVREYEVLVDEAVIGVRHDSVKAPPPGVRGGHPGRPGHVSVKRADGNDGRLPSMSDGNVLRRGDRLRIVTTGGGGWGSPTARRPELVLADVLNGFVSIESAERDYGVVIDPIRREIDAEKTACARARLLNRPHNKSEEVHGHARAGEL